MEQHNSKLLISLRSDYSDVGEWLDSSEQLLNIWYTGMAGNAWTIGKQLSAVRDELRYQGDGFTGFIRRFEWLSESAAYRYMNLAETLEFPTVGNISASSRVLFALASPSTPDDVREDFVQKIEAGEKVTVEAVREARIVNKVIVPATSRDVTVNVEWDDVAEDVARTPIPQELHDEVNATMNDIDAGTIEYVEDEEPEIPPVKWIPARWFAPVTYLDGYRNIDHSKTEEIVAVTCDNRGADRDMVVNGFCQYWTEGQVKHGWSDPVATLRNDRVLGIQISKALQAQGKKLPNHVACPRCGGSGQVPAGGIDAESFDEDLAKFG